MLFDWRKSILQINLRRLGIGGRIMKKLFIIFVLVCFLAINSSAMHPAFLDTITSNPELIQNGTFEIDPYATYWIEYNTPTTQEKSAAQAHSGTYSCYQVGNSAGDGVQANKLFTVISGQNYRIRAWVYIVSGTAYCKDNGNVLDFSMTTSTTGSWQYLTDTAIASSTASERMVIYISSATGEMYWDDISVKAIY